MSFGGPPEWASVSFVFPLKPTNRDKDTAKSPFGRKKTTHDNHGHPIRLEREAPRQPAGCLAHQRRAETSCAQDASPNSAFPNPTEDG